jgi:hypothetical protein
MTRALSARTTFTGGELAPELHGRTELRAYADGARRLRNVLVLPTGGVTRRPGTRFLAELPGPGRLVDFPTATLGRFLIAFTSTKVHVFAGGVLVGTVNNTPWNTARLAQITWAPYQNGLLVAHPDIQLQRIYRDGAGTWTVAAAEFDVEDDKNRQPYARYAADGVTLKSSGTSGTILLQVSAPVFLPGHVGSIVRHKGKAIRITGISANGLEADGNVIEGNLKDSKTTLDWDEAAFSVARGWPRALAFHQGRLVLGGSRDLPGRLWVSRTGKPFDFDLGTGLDDEAMAFDLSSARGETIRHLFAGRTLMVFTSEAEWVVSGRPLTPTNIQVDRQTSAGNLSTRTVAPVDVEGAVMFVGPDGDSLREFLFVDTEQAYRATDLALSSRHLFRGPLDQAFDDRARILFVARMDGTLATVTLERNLSVAAWSLQETGGSVLSVAVSDGAVYLLVARNGRTLLERLDASVAVDAAVVANHAPPTVTCTGLGHLEGLEVAVVADGQERASATVTGGSVTLAAPASSTVIGLGYRHEVEPLPGVPGGGATGLGLVYRPARLDFQLLDSRALVVDPGDGPRRLALGGSAAPASAFTGDASLRVLGWRRGSQASAWRITQDVPLPFTLLSVTTQLKVND